MKAAPIRYVLTTYARTGGNARLSKLGHWGNVPYDDEPAARAAIAADAAHLPHSIERVHR